ncbi:hypothetical protein Pcinc_025862 [Petrolisthes cinctipes]|uniref:Uncharacterized protein n=1 Tax=Petrolisthes cinctipes TaxID=88211 RepID=A0AAE1KB07_PETCI|nr:hypothetical protein Pcinc_025862 [Petrolisthes cinctipes]
MFPSSRYFTGVTIIAEAINEANHSPRLTSQARNIIMNVYHYFRHQDERESEIDVELRTASATGISARSLHRIKRQHQCGEIKSPPSRTRIASVMGSVDDFDKDCIRREVLSFYERGELPTVDTLLERVTQVVAELTFGEEYTSEDGASLRDELTISRPSPSPSLVSHTSVSANDSSPSTNFKISSNRKRKESAKDKDIDNSLNALSDYFAKKDQLENLLLPWAS